MKADTKTDSGTKGGYRPSFYSFDRGEKAQGDVFSILDALEPRSSYGVLWVRAAMIGAIALLAGMLYFIGQHVDVYRNLSPNAVGEARYRYTSVVQASAPQAAEASGAAPIVVDAPLHHAELNAPESPASAAQPVIDAGAFDPDSDPLRTFIEEKANTAPSEVPHPVSEKGSERRTAKDVPSGDKRERRIAAAPKKTVAAASAGSDGNVALPAAQVSHVSLGSTAGRDLRRENMPAQVRPSASPLHDERHADVRRDIVTHDDGETTEALVKRCRALGLIEGELCRLRICSGLWGRDPACPGTPSDPQSAAGG